MGFSPAFIHRAMIELTGQRNSKVSMISVEVETRESVDEDRSHGEARV